MQLSCHQLGLPYLLNYCTHALTNTKPPPPSSTGTQTNLCIVSYLGKWRVNTLYNKAKFFVDHSLNVLHLNEEVHTVRIIKIVHSPQHIICGRSEDVETQMRMGNIINSRMINCINMFSILTRLYLWFPTADCSFHTAGAAWWEARLPRAVLTLRTCSYLGLRELDFSMAWLKRCVKKCINLAFGSRIVFFYWLIDRSTSKKMMMSNSNKPSLVVNIMVIITALFNRKMILN